MDVPTFVVDAFTDRPFAGNPAAVCLLSEPMADDLKQKVAAEMNLSETAFVEPLPSPDGVPTFRLRWFTPKAEIDLCGHATLASAAVLWRERGQVGDLVRFQSRSGELRVARDAGGLTLDFPAEAVEVGPVPPGIVAALGIPNVVASWRGPRSRKVILLLDSPGAVRALQPDLTALAACKDAWGLAITAQGGDQADFTSRYFHPWVGVPEDPVTGSMHTALGPLWAGRLGKQVLQAHQASARGGRMTVEVRGDRVLMTGQAVVVLRGTLSV
jgi:PhzF family phenazine biosynthesis protein